MGVLRSGRHSKAGTETDHVETAGDAHTSYASGADRGSPEVSSYVSIHFSWTAKAAEDFQTRCAFRVSLVGSNAFQTREQHRNKRPSSVTGQARSAPTETYVKHAQHLKMTFKGLQIRSVTDSLFFIAQADCPLCPSLYSF